MAEVAGILVSPFLQVFFERMAAGEFVGFFQGRKLNEGLLQKLKISLLSVNALLEDAEEKQLTKPAVKAWLNELKDAICDAEDVLDEIVTEALQRKLDAEFQTTAKLRGSESLGDNYKERRQVNRVYDPARHECRKVLKISWYLVGLMAG